MKKLLAFAVVATLSGGAVWAEAVKGEWTGYITDTHCGDKGATKDHTKGCVEKCMKGGSKAQIKNDADGKTYDLSSFDQVRPLMGQKVTVKGALDKDSNTITVESAAAAK
jgi:uncharacterized protein DUF5818